jgi:hypothetical protein
MFDIWRNILLYAAHKLFTLDKEKVYLLNVIRLSGGKLSWTVFGQCICHPKRSFTFVHIWGSCYPDAFSVTTSAISSRGLDSRHGGDIVCVCLCPNNATAELRRASAMHHSSCYGDLSSFGPF